MSGHEVSEQMTLFIQARKLIHRTISKEWYPHELFIAWPVESRPDNLGSRIYAWSTSVTELAIRLNDLGDQLDGEFTLEEAIPQARQLVSVATKTLWPGMRHWPLPFARGLTIPEEFATYRFGANVLAAALEKLSQQCFEADFRVGGAGGPSRLPPPSTNVVEGIVMYPSDP
jgi:hypothetical protein